MKVVFCVRHNFHSSPGGAQIQIMKTSAGLKKLGVECDIITSPAGVDWEKYDIIHLSDLTWVYDLLRYLECLKNVRKPKVLSTIYWPFDDYAANGAPFIQRMIFKLFGVNGFEFAKAAVKCVTQRNLVYLRGVTRSYIGNQRSIANQVDWFLPNAETEQQAMNHRLGLNKTNYSVVNNAIDVSLFDVLRSVKTYEKVPNTVVCVGRIDPRKNQMALLNALYSDRDIRITFIGQPGPNSRGYAEELKKRAEVRGNVEFLMQMPQREVFEHLLTSQVHALPSWVETPGLVSLEAAYADCSIVVGKRGSVGDYFRDYAWYCEPDSPESIRKAVLEALQNKPSQGLKTLIRQEYSWDYAAKQTYEAYQTILKQHHS